jgi:hypothetical protein
MLSRPVGGYQAHDLILEGGGFFYFFYVSSGPFEVMSSERDWMGASQLTQEGTLMEVGCLKLGL